MFTLKDLIELGAILATILGSWYSLRERVIKLEIKVTPVYEWFIDDKKEKHKAARAGD